MPLSSPQPARPARGAAVLLVSDQLLGQQKRKRTLCSGLSSHSEASEEAARTRQGEAFQATPESEEGKSGLADSHPPTLLAGEASLLGPELQLKFETQSVLHRKKG